MKRSLTRGHGRTRVLATPAPTEGRQGSRTRRCLEDAGRNPLPVRQSARRTRWSCARRRHLNVRLPPRGVRCSRISLFECVASPRRCIGSGRSNAGERSSHPLGRSCERTSPFQLPAARADDCSSARYPRMKRRRLVHIHRNATRSVPCFQEGEAPRQSESARPEGAPRRAARLALECAWLP